MTEKRKILVVDDDNVIRMLVRRILERCGYEVFIAATGTEGLNLANSSFPDAILLDINLPDLDGYVVCATLRSQAPTRKIPIILMSASDDPEVRARGFDQGADDYMMKPFGEDEVIALLETQLRRQNNARGKIRR